jgi:hypothetical protein
MHCTRHCRASSEYESPFLSWLAVSVPRAGIWNPRRGRRPNQGPKIPNRSCGCATRRYRVAALHSSVEASASRCSNGPRHRAEIVTVQQQLTRARTCPPVIRNRKRNERSLSSESQNVKTRRLNVKKIMKIWPTASCTRGRGGIEHCAVGDIVRWSVRMWSVVVRLWIYPVSDLRCVLQ